MIFRFDSLVITRLQQFMIVCQSAAAAALLQAIEAMELSSQSQQPAAAAAAQPSAAAAVVPPDLLCPITYQLLEDPVMLVDSGQTYERAAIEEWLSRGNTKDPVSGKHNVIYHLYNTLITHDSSWHFIWQSLNF